MPRALWMFLLGCVTIPKYMGGPKMSTKRFKDYDYLYRRLRGTARDVMGLGGQEAAKQITHWPYPVQAGTPSEIEYAVYLTPSADKWQRRRISLKGCTTQEKLYCLKRWYDIAIEDRDNIGAEECRLEGIRIDNYILALVRGGLLDTEYNIRR